MFRCRHKNKFIGVGYYLGYSGDHVMISLHVESSRRAMAIYVFFVAVVATSSVALAESEYVKKLYTWQPIHPYLSSLVQSTGCGDVAGTGKYKPVTVKVGHPYLLQPFTMWEKAKWGAELVWNPGRAVAKRTFDIYDVSSLTLKQLKGIEKAFKDKPVMTGFFVEGEARVLRDTSEVGCRACWGLDKECSGCKSQKGRHEYDRFDHGRGNHGTRDVEGSATARGG